MKLTQIVTASDYRTQLSIAVLYDDEKFLNLNQAMDVYFKSKGHYNYIEKSNHKLVNCLSTFLSLSSNPLEEILEIEELSKSLLKSGDINLIDSKSLTLKAPLQKIPTYRDFYAHELHVKKGFEKRNEPMPKAWYEIPAYYKGSTLGFIGPNQDILWPSYTEVLDYELELGMVIGRDCLNVKAEKAVKNIFGFTILNDISARDIQKKEMSIRLGPAKGKDFCSVIGPVITTIDEFEYKEPNLKMTASVNDNIWSTGYSGDAHFSFSEMIEHVSKDEWVVAGDLFGSGTVGTGCGLELGKYPQAGDLLELEIEKIGKLKNKISTNRGYLGNF
ncbi:MAG: fumarylacetoacetate hydrolase family protein [Halobacteriovoraceae bacterium]|nr:fumarylacetoacetate hydrolase family protein [Halobacteriovoraceae bacterium]